MWSLPWESVVSGGVWLQKEGGELISPIAVSWERKSETSRVLVVMILATDMLGPAYGSVEVFYFNV